MSSIIAKRYAKGFLDAGVEKKSADKINMNLKSFTDILGELKEIRVLLFSPVVSNEKKMEILDVFKKQLKLDDLTTNFLNLLVERRRINYVFGIYECFSNMKNEREGKIKAEIFTAVKPDKGFIDELGKKLKKEIGKEIIPEIIVDPLIVGGIKVKIGTRLYDNTIKMQLEEIEKII